MTIHSKGLCSSIFKSAAISIIALIATPASAQLSDSQMSEIPRDFLLKLDENRIGDIFCREAIKDARRQPSLVELSVNIRPPIYPSTCSLEFDPCTCLYNEFKSKLGREPN